MKELWNRIDWGTAQAFITVVSLPAMIIFGGLTIVLFFP